MIPVADFIDYLKRLAEKDRGALAVLRRGAGFAPGTYPPAFPYVERFVPNEHAQDRRRLARYLVATLFALHPEHVAGTSLAAAFGRLMRKRDSPSLEKRFVALLAAEPEELPVYLRNVVSLLTADSIACDYAALETDLVQWLNSHGTEARDRVRQQWARDFYRALESTPQPGAATSTSDQPNQESTT
jgi:CRISPR system Cascade subunit CasB